MEMKYCGSADNPYCYFHPKDVVVGVCAVCLKERLLILASKQGQLSMNRDAQIRSCRAFRRRSGISLPKVFALASFLHRLDSRRHRRPDDDSDDPESIASLEDSFISIKFEDNGNALWDNKRPPPPPPIIRPSSSGGGGGGGGTTSSGGKEIQAAGGTGSIVEHAKKGGVLRWRKRMGHLLQLARWKRASKATACHAGLGSSAKMEGAVKGRKLLRSDKDSNYQDQDQDHNRHRHRHHRHHHK